MEAALTGEGEELAAATAAELFDDWLHFIFTECFVLNHF